MQTAYIGMGSNLASPAGPPEATLAAAVARLASFGQVAARSSLYSTKPVGFADQPRFLNAVVALETELAPQTLLAALLDLERAFGRNRSEGFPNGPRTLDLDILLMGDIQSTEPGLQIPHPRLADRAFVLIPLNEIAPRAVHPVIARPWLNCSTACSRAVRVRRMQSYRSRAILGALALAVLLPSPRPLCAQKQVSLTVTVTDSADAAISGASVQKPAGHLLGHTDASGRFTFECEIPCRVRIDAEGFIGNYFELTANQTVHLERAGATEEITVTAYREPLGELESPVTTRILSANALATTAAITLDDEVRQLPGVEMFRRSSSLVANPTSQGISVRGLGSTSASRTLVTQDDVPLNDPIGGWIHWEEQPELAIQSAELVRGGASDLYGSAPSAACST